MSTTSTNFDKISARGIVCNTQIGFKDFENGILQPLAIDFAAEVQPIKADHRDSKLHMSLDYSLIIQKIRTTIEQGTFNLIETVGETVANMILEFDTVNSVEVTVTKHPLDLPDIDRVTYTCRRMQRA